MLRPRHGWAMTGIRLLDRSRSVLLDAQRLTPSGIVGGLDVNTSADLGNARCKTAIEPMIKGPVRDVIVFEPELKWPHAFLVATSLFRLRLMISIGSILCRKVCLNAKVCHHRLDFYWLIIPTFSPSSITFSDMGDAAAKLFPDLFRLGLLGAIVRWVVLELVHRFSNC